MTDSKRSAYLFLSLLQARTGSSLVARLGELPPEEVLDMSAAELSGRVRMTEKARRAFDSLKKEFDADEISRNLAARNLDLLTPADPAYPERLSSIPDAPPALFLDGKICEGPAVALVGSRKASVAGRDAARRLATALCERGVCVVSGLALGVDAAAHEGALAGGGPTVGVLGSGIDVVYPKSNRGLFSRVRENGAIISEYYLGEAPLAWRFPARNRIIAGLSDALVVVEAAEKSGALITARHAMESGRDVWAMPGPVGAAECRGSNKLLADGAGVLWDIEEFVDDIAPRILGGETSSQKSHSIPEELSKEEARVLSGVGFEATSTDVVSRHSGVGMRELLSSLALLELKGYVSRDDNGAFARRPLS